MGKLKTKTTVTSFHTMTEFMKKEQGEMWHDSVYTQDYVVSTGCSSFFEPIFSLNMPMRIDCLRIGLVKQGECNPIMNLHQYHCTQHEMLFANWGVVIESDNIAPGTVFSGFAMTEEYLKSIFGDRLPDLYRIPTQNFMISMSEEAERVFDNYLMILSSLIRNEGSMKAIAALFVALLNFIQMLYDRFNVPVQKKWNRIRHQAGQFLQLVNDYSDQEHEIEFYASKLCLTPHYLGIIVRQETGLSAKAWIDRALILNMEMALKYSDMPFKELVEHFHFSSLSSFCRFFKRMVGCTPSEYRNGVKEHV